MLGYKAIVGIGICLLSIALVRIIFMILINSGNVEKIAEEKNTAQRIIISILCCKTSYTK